MKAELNRLLPTFDDLTFPLLRLIDPYGDTLFSSNQMHGFIPEWDRFALNVQKHEDRELVKHVREVAEKCQKNPHTFLRFRGD